MDLKFAAIRAMDEAQARAVLEAIYWPDGPVCPFCQGTEAYKLTAREGSKKPVRDGVYKCKAKTCRKQFTVTVGTVFDGSRIKIKDWIMAVYLMCSSKKGISAHQMHRTIGVTYKTAWFMCHRIRLAMTQGPLADKLTGIVEADETYIGGKEVNKHENKRRHVGGGPVGKVPVFALVQRDGVMRAQRVPSVGAPTLKGILKRHVHPDTRLMTDDFKSYFHMQDEFASHEVVQHSKGEYARGDVNTNSVEGWFALLKRGVMGTFHSVSEIHLNRYCDEFVFRYNLRKVTDAERTVYALKQIGGKKLKYKNTIKNPS